SPWRSPRGGHRATTALLTLHRLNERHPVPRHRRLGSGWPHVHPAPAYAGPERWREAALARRYSETDNPLLPCIDPTQQRYELIRPLLLCPEHTATQRAQETGTHPDTVGRLKRQFAHQGMLGLVPDTLEVLPARRQLRVPDTVVQELQRLKGLYQGVRDRELARIMFHTTMHRITGQTARRLWDRLPPAAPPRPLLDDHSHPAPASARLAVLTLYAQGWSKRSISQVLQVSRPTINLWLV